MAEKFGNLKKILESNNTDYSKLNVLDLDLDNIKTPTPPKIETGGVSIVDAPQKYTGVEIVEPTGSEALFKDIVERKQKEELQYLEVPITGETIRTADPEPREKFKFSNLIPFFGGEEKDGDVREDARLSYLRSKEFSKTLDQMEKRVTKKKGYKEPETFMGQLTEGFKAGIPVLKSAPGYVAEVIGRQTGSPEMVKWGMKYGDKKIAELVLDDTLARPRDMKEFLKGGYSDPRNYGRYIGETLPSIVSMLTFSTAGGLLGGPAGAQAGAYGSIYALEQANAYKSMIDDGVAPDKAGTASSVYGVIAAILENALGYRPATIGTKLAGREVEKEVITNFQKYLIKKLPELPAKILKKSVEEGAEEAAQGMAEDIINKYFDENKEVLKNIPENFFAGTIGSLPFGATEATSQNIQELYDASQRLKPGLGIEDVSGGIKYEQLSNESVRKSIETAKKYQGLSGENLKKAETFLSEGYASKYTINNSTDKKIIKVEKGAKIEKKAESKPAPTRTTETIIKPEKIKAGDRINIVSDTVNKTGRVEKIEVGIVNNEGIIEETSQENEKIYVKMQDVKSPIEIKKGDEATAIFREKKITPPTLRKLGVERPQSRDVTMAEDTLLKKKFSDQSRAVKKAAPSIRKELRTKILNDIAERKTKVDLVKGSIMELSKNIPLAQRGKLLATIKNAKSFKDLAKAKDYIEKLGDISTRKGLITSILKLLKKTKVKKQAGKPVGKYTPEVQKVLDLFNASSKLSSEDAEKIIDGNIEKYKGIEIPDEVALQNRILRMGSGIKDMSNEELEALHSVISSIEETGVLTNALKKFNRQTQVQIWKDNAIDTITGGEGIKEGTETVGVQEQYSKHPKTWGEARKAAKHQLETMGKTFVGWQDILDMMSSKDKESKPYQSWLNEFGETLDEESAYSTSLKKNTVEVRQMFADAYGLETDREIVDKMRDDTEVISLGVFENSEGDSVELNMSKAEARKRWMELQDPTLTKAFEEGMFYTDEMIESINNFLTPKDKQFANSQLDFYQDFYTEINDVYRDIYGVDLPFNPFYSPISRGDIKRDVGDVFDAFKNDIALRKSISKGALKTRVSNKKLINTKSDVQAIQSHVAEMEHFKAWSNKMKDLNSVFSDPEVMTAIEQEYGKGMNAIVQNFLINFAKGGIENAENFNWLDKVRIRFTQGVLAAKPSIAIKQLVSFVAYADAIPVKDYMKGELDFWTNPVKNYKFLRENSKLLQARGENMERDIKSASNSDAYAMYRKKQNYINSMMINIKLGDQAAIVIGGWAVYKHAYNKSKAEGKTEAEAKKDGIRRFEIVTKTTQQSAALSDLSAWQRNPLMKLFTMFLSTPNQYFRKEMGAVRNILTGRGSRAQHMKTIFIFHFLLPMMFQFVSDFGKWDEKEQKRAMILGSLNGLFLIGDGLDYLTRAGLGMRKFDMEQPYMSTFDDISKPIGLLSDEDITMEDVLKAMEGLTDATGKATGLPTGYVWDAAEGIKKLLHGEMTRGLGQLAGWSEYSVDKKLEGRKEKVKAKAPGEFDGIDLGEMNLDNLDLGDLDLGDIDLENLDLENLDFENIDFDNIEL